MELDDDYRTKKSMDRRSKEEVNSEVVSVGETNEEEGVVDNFTGTQQCMNAFDLLQPTIEHELRSGKVIIP